MEKTVRRFLFSVYLQDPFAKPLAKILIKLKIHPNLVTSFGIIVSGFSANSFLQHQYFSASLFLFIALVLDSTDGRVARGLGKFSKFGAALDAVADKLRSIVVAGAFFVSLSLSVWISIFLFSYYLFLPLVRQLVTYYISNDEDPIFFFWNATPIKSWLANRGLVGLYNGWERAFLALIIGPLTPYPIIFFLVAIAVEQALYILGLLIFLKRVP